MRHMLRHFVAEFVGTFAIVFIGSASMMMMGYLGAPGSVALLGVALAHGITLAVFVSALMHVSGHFNPAVSVAFFATGRLEGLMLGIYLGAQLIAAVAATLALQALVPEALFTAARAGGQSISIDITGGQAFALEAIATFFLVFVIFGTAVDEQSPNVGGFAIGLTWAAGILAIGPLTGGSMNPARSLGPAIVSGVYEAQLIYGLAPIVGGAVAGLLYHWLFLRRGAEPVDHGAVAPRP
jgi:aquaporin Z